MALCQRVAEAVKAALKLPGLQLEWVPVTAANRFDMLRQGRIDIDCATDTPTIERRAVADFSIPISIAGVGAVMRTDGDRRVLIEALPRVPRAAQLTVLDRVFAHSTLALSMPRGDSEFRWLVDRTLSRLYRVPEFGTLDTPMAEFYRLVALPE